MSDIDFCFDKYAKRRGFVNIKQLCKQINVGIPFHMLIRLREWQWLLRCTDWLGWYRKAYLIRSNPSVPVLQYLVTAIFCVGYIYYIFVYFLLHRLRVDLYLNTIGLAYTYNWMIDDWKLELIGANRLYLVNDRFCQTCSSGHTTSYIIFRPAGFNSLWHNFVTWVKDIASHGGYNESNHYQNRRMKRKR